MATHDFEVDIEALFNAAKKSAEVVQLKKDKDVEDYVPREDDVANTILWDAVAEFKDRWERGTNDMTDDLEEVAGRLGKVATNYSEYSEESEKKMATVKSVMDGLSTERIIGGGE